MELERRKKKMVEIGVYKYELGISSKFIEVLGKGFCNGN